MTTPIRLQHPDKLFINGQWVSPVQPAMIDIISPNTEQRLHSVAEAREADMDKAVKAAREAFDKGPWPRLSPQQRAEYLQALAAKLTERHGELSQAWVDQIGGLAMVAPFLVASGTGNFMDMVEVAKTFEFEKKVASDMAAVAYVVREPVGVVATIAPWNVPYAIMTSKVAPALLAGCTVIMKPAPETPLEAYIVAECAQAVGIPAGVINLVTSHREAADHLVRNPGIDKVAFTGSTAAGRRIGSVCGERVARCTLELGGKSAAIILDDMPIAEAAQILTQTITTFTGQVCAMLSRALVSEKRHDELAEAIATAMKQVKVGYSTDPQTQMGPLAMKRQLERVQSYIEKGQAEGAKLVTGGKRPAHLERGYFIEPTLFANVDNRWTIAQEEIFGPVLSLIPYKDEADAVRIANDTIFGLNSAVFTKDADAAYRIGRQMRAGNVGQNAMKADFKLPFGGFKQSGCGREGGAEGLMAFLETKTMLLDGAPRTA
jgi:aldehyde dehydrogenase (NAD+)